jgi:hypothetical protein
VAHQDPAAGPSFPAPPPLDIIPQNERCRDQADVDARMRRPHHAPNATPERLATWWGQYEVRQGWLPGNPRQVADTEKFDIRDTLDTIHKCHLK